MNSRFSKNLWRYHTKILRRKSISCRTDFLKLISLLTLLNAELPKCSKLSKSVWFFFSAWNLKFYANIYLGFTDSHKCAGLAAERVDPSSPGGSVLNTKMKPWFQSKFLSNKSDCCDSWSCTTPSNSGWKAVGSTSIRKVCETKVVNWNYGVFDFDFCCPVFCNNRYILKILFALDR